MSAAKAAMKKMGVRRKWADPLPPDAEEGFSSQEDLEEILDRFEKDGVVQVQFGKYGVYTITKVGAVAENGHLGRMVSPVAVWWKGRTQQDRISTIITNSRMSYHLPSTEKWGQALQLNLTANFFESYGKEATPRQAAAGFLNIILAGVAIHRTSCGVTTSNDAYRLNIPEEERHTIKVLPRAEA